MASEDALEDLPGDQLVDSLVQTEQSDTESSVGNRGQSRPQYCAFSLLSFHLSLWPFSFLSASSFTSCKNISCLTTNHL